MDVADVLTVALAGNRQCSWSTISLAELLSSLYLSNRKGSAVSKRKQFSPAVQQICYKNPKKGQLFVIGIRAIDM